MKPPLNLFLALTIATIIGCKKDNSQDALLHNMQLMEGDHIWIGKKYFLSPDSNFVSVHDDSADIGLDNIIHVLNSRTITFRSYLNSPMMDTLSISSIDAANKILIFNAAQYSSGSVYIATIDCLSFNYSNNSLCLHEALIDGILTSHVNLHSP